MKIGSSGNNNLTFGSTLTSEPVFQLVEQIPSRMRSLSQDAFVTTIMDCASDTRYPNEQQQAVNWVMSIKDPILRKDVISDLRRIKDDTVQKCIASVENILEKLG